MEPLLQKLLVVGGNGFVGTHTQGLHMNQNNRHPFQAQQSAKQPSHGVLK